MIRPNFSGQGHICLGLASFCHKNFCWCWVNCLQRWMHLYMFHFVLRLISWLLDCDSIWKLVLRKCFSIFYSFQFVCFGGSPNRMEKFAHYMVGQLNEKIPAGMTLCNISHGSDRYVLYKVGPVLSVSVSRIFTF